MGRTEKLKKMSRSVSAVLLAAVFVGGCGAAPKVEIESPLLGYLGLLGNDSNKETKLVDRPPLVPPPTKKLPVPGSGETAGRALDWPIDPGDREREVAAAETKKKKQYEDNGDWSKNRAPGEFDKLLDDPYARGKKGIFGDWSADVGRTSEPIPENQ